MVPIVVVGKIDTIEVVSILGGLCHNSYMGDSCCDIWLETRVNNMIGR